MIVNPGLRRGASAVAAALGQASTQLPLLVSTLANKGSNLTLTRADATSCATVVDFEGLVKVCKANEIRETGARRVENLFPSSEDFSNAAWQKGATASVTGTQVMNFPAVNDYVQCNLNGNVAGKTYVCTFTLSGSGTISIGFSNNIDYAPTVRVTLSTTPTKYSFLTTFNGTVSSVYSCKVQRNSGDTSTVTCATSMLELVTDQSNQNPSEYVSSSESSTGALGVKYFPTSNGNTVSSNVVTEATGTPLTTMKGALTEPSRTNKYTNSSDLSSAAWSLNGSGTKVLGLLAPDGSTNGATITSNTGGYNPLILSGFTVAGFTAGQAVTSSIYAKAGAIENVLTIHLGDTAFTNNAACTFNLSTGVSGTPALTGLASAAVATIINAGGGWYRCALTCIVDSTTTAIRADYEFTLVSGRSMPLWGPQLEQAPNASSYIPTTTAAVTRAADVATIPTSGNITAAAGTVYVEWTPQSILTGDNYIAITTVDASNYTALIYNSTGSLIVRKRIAGVNSDATYTVTATVGTTYKIAGSWGAAGVLGSVGGVSGTLNANTTNAQIGSTLVIGQNAGERENTKNLRTWTTQLSQAQLNALTR